MGFVWPTNASCYGPLWASYRPQSRDYQRHCIISRVSSTPVTLLPNHWDGYSILATCKDLWDTTRDGILQSLYVTHSFHLSTSRLFMCPSLYTLQSLLWLGEGVVRRTDNSQTMSLQSLTCRRHELTLWLLLVTIKLTSLVPDRESNNKTRKFSRIDVTDQHHPPFHRSSRNCNSTPMHDPSNHVSFFLGIPGYSGSTTFGPKTRPCRSIPHILHWTTDTEESLQNWPI